MVFGYEGLTVGMGHRRGLNQHCLLAGAPVLTESQCAKDGEGFGGVGKAPPGRPGGGGLGWYLSNRPAGWLGTEPQGAIPSSTRLGAPGSVWTCWEELGE